MMEASFRAQRSGVKSPVSSMTLLERGPCSSLFFQSLILSFARAFKGATYMILESLRVLNARSMASSAMMVLPEPVGAPMRTLQSEWYNEWKTYVWTGLKKSNLSL